MDDVVRGWEYWQIGHKAGLIVLTICFFGRRYWGVGHGAGLNLSSVVFDWYVMKASPTMRDKAYAYLASCVTEDREQKSLGFTLYGLN